MGIKGSSYTVIQSLLYLVSLESEDLSMINSPAVHLSGFVLICRQVITSVGLPVAHTKKDNKINLLLQII